MDDQPKTTMSLPQGAARRSVRALLCCAPLVLACLAAPPEAARSEECEAEPGVVQLLLIEGVEIEDLLVAHSLELVDSLPPAYLLRTPPESTDLEFLALLEQSPLVREAELAYRTESPEGVQQMTVAAVGGTYQEFRDQDMADRLRLPEAHGHTIGEGVLVAFLDTGVSATHEALVAHLDPRGWDYVDGDDDPEETADGIDGDLDGATDEGAGHGTMVAGIVHLVAPGARLLPVRVLDDEGRGLTFQVAKGIRYAIETGAQVVNLSFGLDCESAILREEITRANEAGLILVAAAGNDGSDTPIYPANDPLAICVAGLDSLDVKATFSSYGESVDISAPAVGVYSTFRDGGYGIGDGTSFAAPIVSGQAALTRATNQDLSREDVEGIMGAGVVDIYGIPGNAEYVDLLGSGRVDAFLTWSLVPASAGVDAAESGPRLRAYPNPSPAGGWVTVEFVQAGTAADADRRVGAASSTGGAGGLSIHDAAGRLVRRLGEPVTPGRHRWDGRDGSGRIVPSGLYWVRVPQTDARLQVVILPR